MINNKEWDKDVVEMMEDPNYEVSYNLLPNSSKEDEMKYQTCQDILKFKIERNLEDEEIANHLNINEKKAKKILLCHIDEFELGELVGYAEKLAQSFNLNLYTTYSNVFTNSNNNYYNLESSNKNKFQF